MKTTFTLVLIVAPARLLSDCSFFSETYLADGLSDGFQNAL